MAGKITAKTSLTLRILVVDPPPGVTWALQRGRDELIVPDVSSPGVVGFTFSIDVADAASAPPRLLGKCTQGPPDARFVYLTSGRSAGQFGSPWTRRAKVPLTGITAELIAAAMAQPGARLETSIRGTGKDGGPSCATVRLLTDWCLVAASGG